MGMRIENRCCGCAVPGYPCKGNNCSNRNVKVYFCDECKGEESPEDLYVYETAHADFDLCESCLLERIRKEFKRVSDYE